MLIYIGLIIAIKNLGPYVSLLCENRKTTTTTGNEIEMVKLSISNCSSGSPAGLHHI